MQHVKGEGNCTQIPSEFLEDTLTDAHGRYVAEAEVQILP